MVYYHKKNLQWELVLILLLITYQTSIKLLYLIKYKLFTEIQLDNHLKFCSTLNSMGTITF
jgi:hypothetical protein